MVRRLVNITEYKQKAMTECIKDSAIVTALTDYNTEFTKIAQSDPSELIYLVVFPYMRISERVVEDSECTLLFEVNEYEDTKNWYATKDVDLLVTILCDQKIMKYTNGTRIDYIGELVKKIFDKNNTFVGGGRMLRLIENTGHVLTGGTRHYRTLTFTTKDSNMKC